MKKRQGSIELILIAIIVILLIGGLIGYVVLTKKDKNTSIDRSNEPQQTGGAVLEQGSSGCTPDPIVVEAKDPFTKAPFDVSQVKVITPGKETNDPRFVYVWVNTSKSDRVNISAPADGKLYMIRHKVFEIDGKKGNDYDMFFAVDCKTVFRFNHITNPRDDIKATYPAGDLPSGDYANGGLDIAERVKPTKAIEVKAGESLGYTTGTPIARNFDYAIGISTSREGDKMSVCPLTVFKDPLKTQLTNLLGSKAAGAPVPGYGCQVESKKF